MLADEINERSYLHCQVQEPPSVTEHNKHLKLYNPLTLLKANILVATVNHNMNNNLPYENVDTEAMALRVSTHGSGNVSILNTYWNEGIAVIQIDNVKKRNAVSGKMIQDFRNCIAQLESWKEGKAVILQGCGENFCSGGDLDFAREFNTRQDGFELSTLMNDALIRLEKLPLISIALIHGPTLGGGAEIAIACDYILACKNVKFGFVHGKMGIITAWGGTTRLVEAIGKRQALELLLTSKIVDAKDCLRIGIISKILNNENKLDECLEWTRSRTQHDYRVNRAFKQAVLPKSKDYLEKFIHERTLFTPLWGSVANTTALRKNIKHITSDD